MRLIDSKEVSARVKLDVSLEMQIDVLILNYILHGLLLSVIAMRLCAESRMWRWTTTTAPNEEA